ncbi:MAG: hypothetical protein ACK5M3_00915, partial [Dysgonomonas sp.]
IWVEKILIAKSMHKKKTSKHLICFKVLIYAPDGSSVKERSSDRYYIFILKCEIRIFNPKQIIRSL